MMRPRECLVANVAGLGCISTSICPVALILREGQGAIEIENTIKWLRHENAKGAHIYVRPAGAHCLSLIDDLSAEAIDRMKAEGFEPAVVVETSTNNFQ